MKYQLTMTSDLGDQLSAMSLSGSEQLGRPFTYQLRARSERPDIDLRALLGSSITATYQEGAFKRHFNGIVSEAAQGATLSFQGKQYTEYMLTLVPKAWLALHKIDCRIYLNQSVPEIVKAVLADIGYSDIKLDLTASYPKREYCVQYRESCFNFISRLLEKEGIYYFFRHKKGTHTMVLADSLGAHSTTSGFETLPFVTQTTEGQTPHETAITNFAPTRSVRTTKYSLTDYDPLKPKTSLLGSGAANNADDNHPVDGLESFDYPGEHETAAVGKHYAQMRIEAINAAQSVFDGATSACGLLTGALFTLKGFPQNALNKEYLVVGSSVQVDNPIHSEDESEPGAGMYCSFTAIHSRQPFRTMPAADKPVIVGLQTAIVTGSKTDEDIAVDKHGRIQVNFHWNMPDKKHAHCSCPVRVATSWAGKNWGAVSFPRVGQEVVVSFIEGDPDRPLIVGSVYNGVNTPPYELPANKTQSGIKSRSLLGGTADFNELRFEDKKGKEDFFMHAQKDMHEEVENDHTVTIDHDEILTVKNDQTETINNNRTHKVDADDKLTVGKSGTVDIGTTYKLTAGDEIKLVCGAASITMKSSGQIDIKGSKISISATSGVKVNGMTVDVAADTSASLKGLKVNVEGSAKVAVSGAMASVTGSGVASVSGGIVKLG